jgi:dipeptidyl aminopeptidase/acylaminoacyl peptidase
MVRGGRAAAVARKEVGMRSLSRLIVVGCLVALATAGTVRAEAPASLTPEIVESLVTISNVSVHPSGLEILYRRVAPRGPDEDPGAPRGELWAIPFEGGEPKLLVAGGSNPSSPAWSPDGRSVAFLSTRETGEGEDDERSRRLFVLPRDGGEAQPVSPAGFRVESFVWSSDSASLAFVATDPEPDERRQARKRGEDWTVVETDTRPRRLHRVQVATGKAEALTGPELAVWDIGWSPDGKWLVAAVTDSPARTDDEYMLKRLVVVPAAGGEPRPLAPTIGKMGPPRWSPDGRWIAWLGGTDRHDPSEGTIYLIPAAGGERRALHGDLELNFRQLAWLGPDRLVASGEQSVRTRLVTVTVPGGEIRDLPVGAVISGAVSFSRDGSRHAFAGHTRSHPTELFAAEAGEPPRRLTISNPVLERIPLGEQGPFAWAARDGTRIEGVLIKPPEFREGTHYPLLITPHGGPEFASLDGWNAAYVYPGRMAAARGYLVLLPNYRGSTGRGEAFARANHRDLGGTEFEDVLDAIQALVDRGWADPARVGIGGGSYGGYFSALGATHHTERFAAAVVFAGISNWVSFTGTSDIPQENTWVHWGVEAWWDHAELLWGRSPLAAISRAGTPTLILHGEKDLRVPLSQGTELFTALRLRGVPVEMVTYPRAEHSLRERAHRLDAARRMLDWFDRYLKP